MTSLTIKGLSKSFGREPVVRSLDLSVARGEIVALLGPSGCGKTTTLRCIAGLEQPDQGSIVIGDQIVCDTAAGIMIPPERREIGMMFQSYAIWPHLTVYENVAYGLRVKKLRGPEIERRVASALETVGLGHVAQRYPSMLSGGQQQRVALARSLAPGPKLLLMDEPLSNLDLKLRERMRVELRDLLKQLGHTAIYVTHDQTDAMIMADRLVLMNAGEIAELGEPREIYNRPRTVFGSTFLGSANLISFSELTREADRCYGRLSGGQVLELTSVNGKAQHAIRPERIDIDREPRSDWSGNTLRGKVRKSMFLGNLTYYEVDCPGISLLVQSQSNDYSVGEELALHLPARWLVAVE